jgi:beta-N-acetylglucosaminidase
MPNRLMQSSFIMILIIALLITLGLYTLPAKPHELSQGSRIVAAAQSAVPVVAMPATISQPLPPYSTVIVEEPISAEPLKDEAPDESAPAAPLSTVIPPEPLIWYEVTAYYLNVRTEPNPQSSILKVVEQGEQLQIAAHTDNGWLQLEQGGYVNSRHAKAVAAVDEPHVKGKVSIAAYEDEQAEAAGLQEDVPDKRVQAEAAQHAASAEAADNRAMPEQAPPAAEPGKPTKQVQSESGLTEAHIEQILEGTALAGHGLERAILDIEAEYGINAFFTIAVMKLESGNGKSKIAKNKNNLFGLNAVDGDQYNKAFSFKTKGDSVQRFGELLAKHYVGKGLETIDQVARKYCPSNSKWPTLVMSIMKSDYRKL